jgi:hypothetical protein
MQPVQSSIRVITNRMIAYACFTGICVAANLASCSKHVSTRLQRVFLGTNPWLPVFVSRTMHVCGKHTKCTVLLQDCTMRSTRCAHPRAVEIWDLHCRFSWNGSLGLFCAQNFHKDTIYADCLLVPQGTSKWLIWQLKLVKPYQAKAALLRAACKLILAIADTCTLSDPWMFVLLTRCPLHFYRLWLCQISFVPTLEEWRCLSLPMKLASSPRWIIIASDLK